MATHTPWGASDSADHIAPGIVNYTTASHGGVHVSARRLAAMPTAWHLSEWAPAGWYEEDCDWALVVLAFPEAFASHPAWLKHALGCAFRWHADIMDAFTPAMAARYAAACAAANVDAEVTA